jgi:hypothetical protein
LADNNQSRCSTRRILKIAAAVVALSIFVPVLIFLALFFWMPPWVPTDPVHLVRNADGQLVSTGSPEAKPGLSFDFQAGKISSSNIFGSASGSSSSGVSPFACSRIVLINPGDNLLMARVGQLLLGRLRELPGVQQFDYYPGAYKFEDGSRAPDVIVTLELQRLVESVGVTEQKLEADLAVYAGASLIHEYPASYRDDLSPPVFAFDWKGNLRHSSTVTGVTSASAKYKLQSEDIAKQIADKLLDQFRDWREKYRPLPQLPAAFYPAYRPLETMPWGQDCKAEQLGSWHGLMNHNNTYYRLTTERNVVDFLAGVEGRMKADGWKTQEFFRNPPEMVYLRMRRGSAVFEIYPERPREAVLSQSKTEKLAISSEAGQSVLNAHYTDRMSSEELAAAIDELLTPDIPAETLTLFEHYWNQAQGRKALELLTSRRPASCQGWLAVAKIYNSQKQDDEAKAALMRANIMLQTLNNEENIKSQIRDLAKELGDDKTLDAPLDVNLLRELGFVELKADAVIQPRDMVVDEPACFFGVTQKGEINIVTLRVVETGRTNNLPAYGLTVIKKAPSYSSRSSSSITMAAEEIEGACRANFTIEKPGDGKHFRLITTISEATQPPPSKQ